MYIYIYICVCVYVYKQKSVLGKKTYNSNNINRKE